MYEKNVLLEIVAQLSKIQIELVVYELEELGFYREDKRRKKMNFIIDVIKNAYTTDIDFYGLHDFVSMDIEEIILKYGGV